MTMRLKIHRSTPHAPDTVYLSLIELGPGEIMLAAVDENGDSLRDPDHDAYGGGLLTITDEGRLVLSPAVMPALGFQLDGVGRIALDGYAESLATKHAQRFGGKRAAFREVK